MAHAWMAKQKGDSTGELMGRLTMNPFAHADPIGTFVLPLSGILFNFPFAFGWAKPVPVNERNLKHPLKDMFWIALAGPASNVLLAVIAAIVCAGVGLSTHSAQMTKMSIQGFAFTFVVINLMLATFNLIPINPLDGGKVIARFLPRNANQFLEEHQTTLNMGLLLLFMMGGLRILGPFIQGASYMLVDTVEFGLRLIF